MRRYVLPGIICLFLALPVFGQSGTALDSPPFRPMSPRIWGQGGGYTAIAEGYESLFTNPAGYALESGKKGRSITLMGLNSWFYARPDYVLPFTYQLSQGADLADSVDIITDQITAGGFGIGTSAGMGYVGNGLGLGFITVLDSYLYGQSLLGAEGEIHATFAFIGGLAFSFQMGGSTLYLGGDVRPMLRMYAPIENSAVLGMLTSLVQGGSILSALNDEPSYSGIGLAVDVGALLTYRGLSFGLSMRDIGGTSFKYHTGTYGEDFGGLLSARLPEGGPIDTLAVTPMDLSIGLAYNPVMSKLGWLIDPSVYVEVQDITGAVRENRSFWTMLHGGTEVKLLSFFNLRAGISQGYLTFGGGFKLLILDLNAALFTRELGLYSGDRPNTGIAIEAALRF